MPLQTVLALALAFVLRGSKIAAVLGTWVSNPLCWAPQYMLVYHTGRALAPFDVPVFDVTRLELGLMLDSGWKLFAAMMMGGLVLAVPLTLCAYLAVFRAVKVYRNHRRLRSAIICNS